MGTVIAYRVDTEDYGEGDPVAFGGDHIDRLHGDDQVTAEMAIREAHPNGTALRSDSIFVWKNERMAELAWNHKRGQHLYEVEVDEANIVHTGDLDHFTSTQSAIRRKQDPSPHAKNYWTAVPKGERVELLVTAATVVRRMKHDNEHRSIHAQAIDKLNQADE